MTPRAGCRWVLVALVVAGVVGCGDGGSPQRPEILYGEHECDQCRMIVSEERFAAVALVEGVPHRFDDLGCLARWAAGRELAGASIWVHDAASAEWLEPVEAVFIRSAERVTPMGSGWLAVSPAHAREFRSAGSETLDWNGFRQSAGMSEGAQVGRSPEETRPEGGEDAYR